MIFDKFSIKKILNGEKYVTRRIPYGRRPAVPGKIHKLKADRTKKTYGLILIEECELSRVKDIDDKEAKREGFNSRQEYINYFIKVNNINGLAEDDLLWRIKFEVLLWLKNISQMYNLIYVQMK